MANFSDYIDWRGDLSFAASPFNEIDFLLFSYLSYVNFDDIVPYIDEGSITIEEASHRFFMMHTEEEIEASRSFIRLAPRLLRKMAGAKRYKDLQLLNYVNRIDLNEAEQFSALEIRSDRSSMISYRGTDDTIIGWKEDFNISYQITPGEADAIHYLNRIAMNTQLPIRLGGHSKGGHLAVFAAAGCARSIQDHIISIGDFDGPGFHEDFLVSEGYRTIKDRILRVLPETSIVGMLLEMDVEPLVIQSSEVGAMQHDAFSWQVLGTSFIRSAGISMEGKLFDETLTTWISQIPMDERKPFIDDLFSVLEASGAETLTDLQNGGVKLVPAMITQLRRLNPNTARTTWKLLSLLFENWLNAGELLNLPFNN